MPFFDKLGFSPRFIIRNKLFCVQFGLNIPVFISIFEVTLVTSVINKNSNNCNKHRQISFNGFSKVLQLPQQFYHDIICKQLIICKLYSINDFEQCSV